MFFLLASTGDDALITKAFVSSSEQYPSGVLRNELPSRAKDYGSPRPSEQGPSYSQRAGGAVSRLSRCERHEPVD